MKTLLLAVCAGLLGGCAMSDSACRTTDWYALGERDALTYGLRPQIDQYAQQCAQYNVQPGEKEYLAGWFDGDRERAVRMLGGACCAP
jgi:hypothetical protein